MRCRHFGSQFLVGCFTPLNCLKQLHHSFQTSFFHGFQHGIVALQQAPTKRCNGCSQNSNTREPKHKMVQLAGCAGWTDITTSHTGVCHDCIRNGESGSIMLTAQYTRYTASVSIGQLFLPLLDLVARLWNYTK